MNHAGKILLWCTIAVGTVQSQTTPVPKKEARVTQIIREVNLMPTEEPARPAQVNDEVNENTAVRTGIESRSELTFEDLTITRLGANTIFSFNKAGRSVDLEGGTILLRVPKDSGGAEIRTKAVTVGITGTTVIFQSTPLGRANLISLEGEASLKLVKYPRQIATVRPGQMLDVKAGATKLPKPVRVDLAEIMKKNPLIADFPPLPSQDLILAEIRNQQNPALVTTPASPTPRPTIVPRPGPRFTSTPRPQLTPNRTPTPRPTATAIPPASPKPTTGLTPRPTSTPKPTASPRKSPPPRPLPSPRPTATPKTIGGSQIPPKGTKRPIKKTPTPTPTPVIIR